ncbi:MAG: hypothetical protein KAU20_03105, partial [Nanoarchaeota archaeon]|nr:hypothetical protein [Nanoarchaeota archaeon]
MNNNINNRKENMLTLVALIIIITGFFLIKPAYTGYVALEDNGSYTDILNINITSNTSYIWEPENKGNIDSIRLSGYLEGDYANVYVKKDNESYLVYEYGVGNVTIEAVEVSSGDNEINISFEYYDGSSYDADNDGIAHINDIIDFNVNNTVFNFDVNYSKLCTKYKVDNKELNTSVCYGYDECCLFIGLSPESENWDDIFYLNYGKYNAGYNNTVYSQVVYYDVNLEGNDIYSYIYNSGVYALDAVFVDRIYFNDACVESCSLIGFDDKEYELVFEVDGIVYIDNISYGISSSVKEEIVSIKDRDKKKIGHYKLKNKTNGKYDLEISSLEKSLKGVMDTARENKAKIKNIEKLKKLDVYIDEIVDKKVSTDVFAVNESLEFDYAEITLAKNGDVNAVMYCSEFDFDEFSCSEWEKTSIPFVDNGDTITFTVDKFSAYAGAEIKIINVHSYPSLYGNWTVMFNTTGTADLTITAARDVNYSEEYTRWSDYSESGLYDLKFLEIRCGDEVKQYEWQGSNCYENECSVFIEDYSCNETAYEISKVLTAKRHVLKFSFGGQEVYAYNDVLELDYMEYANDTLAQAAYVSSEPEIVDQSFETNWDCGNVLGDASGIEIYQAVRFTTSDIISCSSASIYIADEDKTPEGNVTLRIETSVGNEPSGTLVHENASCAMPCTGIVLDAWAKCSFTAFSLPVGTYWLVAKLPDQARNHMYIILSDEDGIGWGGEWNSFDGAWSINENFWINYFRIYRLSLQSYSESTIKQQGSYSLKAIAQQTDSLNDTLTRTVSPTINLSGKDSIKLDVRANRIGSNFKIGIHDSGGTTTEHTVNIATANTWQTETWDIYGVGNADKDVIDQIIINITNADAGNTFYIDNMSAKDNQLPTAPTVLYPDGGEVIADGTETNWSASTDPEGDIVKYYLSYSNDSGVSWYSIVSDWGYINYLNDSSTSKNLTFGGNENKTVYVDIPKVANLTSAKIDLTGIESLGLDNATIGECNYSTWSIVDAIYSGQVYEHDLSTTYECDNYAGNYWSIGGPGARYITQKVSGVDLSNQDVNVAVVAYHMDSSLNFTAWISDDNSNWVV